jgi:outer membrane receptor protein involved in Fe transport
MSGKNGRLPRRSSITRSSGSSPEARAALVERTQSIHEEKNVKHSTKPFIFVVLLLIAAGALFAQTSRTTGAIQGRVTDGSGAPLPGVTVTITGPALQGPRTAVTDTTGEYALPVLPPGKYNVEFALSGIQSVIRSNVTVGLNQTTKLDVPMKIGISEAITVTANTVVIDPTQSTQQQNFAQDHLKYAVVGSAGRTYQSVLAQAAGSAGGNGSTGPGGGGNPQVSGANSAQNNFMMDGINTTDPVTHTFGYNMAFDAIQEMSIQTLGKSAEYGSSGGTINVITKSGGNRFSGSFDERFNNGSTQFAGKATHPTGIAYYGATATGSALNYDKNLQPVKNSNPQATVGGPLMTDRLWFFVALMRPDTASTPPATQGFTPGTRTFKGWNNLGKITFTPVANQTVTALFSDSYAAVGNTTNSSFYSPEASYTQTQGGRTLGLVYDAILSPKWILNLQGGHTPARLAVLPNSGTALAYTNNNTSVRTGNYSNAQGRTSTRDELLGNTTYYVEKFGTHSLKAGLDYNKTDFSSYNYNSGDPTLAPGWDPAMCSSAHGFPNGIQCAAQIVTQSGTTYLLLGPKNPIHTVSAKQYAYFAQDEWNPMTRLTIRAGLRLEQIKWNNPKGNNPPNFSKVQPRLGAAYDIFDNASSIVHGFAGRVMDDNQLTLVNYGYEQPSGTRQFAQNANGTWTDQGGTIYTSGATYASDLKPSYSNQYSIGFTQKVWRNTSIDATFETRNQKNLFEDYCGYIAGTTVVSLPACVITNQPGFDIGAKGALRSDYHALITKIESRPYQWLDLVASWAHASSKGSTESTQNAATSFDYYPVFFHNTYGYLSDDARNRVKIDGYIRLPLDIIFGVNQYWDDGIAYSVFQNGTTTAATGVVFPPGYSTASFFIEPRGSRRLPNFSQTDLQIEKDFRFGSTKIGLIASLFNAFDHETAVGINGNAGTRAIADPSTGKLYMDPNQQAGVNRLSPTYGQQTTWQRPRRYEVGLRFEF